MKIDKSYIEKELCGYPYVFDIRDMVTSTNSILKEAAKKGEKEYSVLIASSQSKGRGRMGRYFFSPEQSGLYMSVLLRPEGNVNPLRITTDAAVACAKAVEKISGKSAGIKWVNDIYINNRKVCGILAESSIGEKSFVILGVGVNVFMPECGFPDDIKMRAGSVLNENLSFAREKVAVAILKELYNMSDENTVFEEYCARSVVTGKEIDVIKNSSVEHAVAISINEDYSLKVKFDNGKIENLSSGDVSIKMMI